MCCVHTEGGEWNFERTAHLGFNFGAVRCKYCCVLCQCQVNCWRFVTCGTIEDLLLVKAVLDDMLTCS